MIYDGKRILLGVSGGIAAYKAAELARRLVSGGAKVKVVMTRAAQEFVSLLTFQALTGEKVATTMFGRRETPWSTWPWGKGWRPLCSLRPRPIFWARWPQASGTICSAPSSWRPLSPFWSVRP